MSPAPNAPLAAVLTLSTDREARVSVLVDDGRGTWTRDFHDYQTNHSVPLLGFKPNRTNTIVVTVHDRDHNSATAAEPLVLVTAPLPADFPHSVLLTNQPEKMEPGYTLFRIQNRNNLHAYVTIVDNNGEVVWYSDVPTTADVRQLGNGDLFIPLATGFVEINMLGETVSNWPAPANLQVDIHDGVPTDHGTILYLSDASRVVTDFPSSATNPSAPPYPTASVLYNKVVEMSAADASILGTWSPIDVLDPRRLTYLTFDFFSSLGWDIEHANAVLEDPRDNSLIVSMREQNAVIKFSRDTGQLKWILGPHEGWGPAFQQYLLTPLGTPFAWNYGQHAPMLTPNGTLLLHDNGNYRATPFDPPVADADNYSRTVEYLIDETNMTVSQVWEYRNVGAERLFTPIIGDADWLTNSGNVLSTFGYISYVDGVSPSPAAPTATMVRIKEVTHDPVPEVVFDLSFFDYDNTNATYRGYFCYRSDRITDLYAHPPAPVADLSMKFENGFPVLEFTADATRTYTIQASTDLAGWEDLGAPAQDESGVFSFVDQSASDSSRRFYRVLTR